MLQGPRTSAKKGVSYSVKPLNSLVLYDGFDGMEGVLVFPLAMRKILLYLQFLLHDILASQHNSSSILTIGTQSVAPHISAIIPEVKCTKEGYRENHGIS